MDLLDKVKANLILTHNEDDALIRGYIAACISFAESCQKKGADYYAISPMSPLTEQAVVMLASHMYESRDGGTGGFFGDNVQAARQIMDTVRYMLALEKDWQV